MINAFSRLGEIMVALGEQKSHGEQSAVVSIEKYEHTQEVINKQFHLNGWFTKISVCNSLKALGSLMTEASLTAFTEQYIYSLHPKKVGVIMAGNLPLVGFHDFLCVLLSGHKVVAKMSSDDKTLLPALVNILLELEPKLAEYITLSEGRIGEIDAIIATGSNNSMGYFETYFGKYPHIFRKNRTSVAILDGTETEAELQQLGSDIFTYFGLGCRNVSQLLVPENFELNRFFGAIVGHAEIVNHHKYANNYDYNKAIHLMNQENILDNGFVLLKASDELFSPLAMLFYHRYKDPAEVTQFLEGQSENIQAVVSHQHIPFGQAQCPGLNDFADNVNTMEWLGSL